MQEEIDLKWNIFPVLDFFSQREPIMQHYFDYSYLKKLFDFFKTVKSNFKLSKNYLKKDQFIKNIAYPPIALIKKSLNNLNQINSGQFKVAQDSKTRQPHIHYKTSFQSLLRA